MREAVGARSEPPKRYARTPGVETCHIWRRAAQATHARPHVLSVGLAAACGCPVSSSSTLALLCQRRGEPCPLADHARWCHCLEAHVQPRLQAASYTLVSLCRRLAAARRVSAVPGAAGTRSAEDLRGASQIAHLRVQKATSEAASTKKLRKLAQLGLTSSTAFSSAHGCPHQVMT